MANRVFQNVVYQMKDAIDRVVGVVDETGAVIACSELGQIGEMREGFAVARLTAGDAFEKDGYAYHQFSNAKHNDYAVFVEGNDPTAAQFASLLSISLQSIKQYHDEKFDKTNFIKNVVLDNILPGDIYAKAREDPRYGKAGSFHCGYPAGRTLYQGSCRHRHSHQQHQGSGLLL